MIGPNQPRHPLDGIDGVSRSTSVSGERSGRRTHSSYGRCQNRPMSSGAQGDPGIYLAASPIGDPRDASEHLRSALAGADLIAAEDTRKLRALCDRLHVHPTGRVVSYFEGNEAVRTDELIQAARAGNYVLVISDAGMPLVSDPGYRVVSAAIEAGVDVRAIPGPSAVTTALALSGLPCDRFCFEGFLPRKAGERSSRLASLSGEVRTMVFFEAPHRSAATLAAMAEVLGADRAAAVCRELTKTYEEVRRGSLSELAEWAAEGLRGEITIVVAGASNDDLRRVRGLETPVDWVRAVDERVASGVPRKEAIVAVAEEAGRPRREVYDAVLRAKV